MFYKSNNSSFIIHHSSSFIISKMKFLFYIVVIIFLYRVLFRPKVIVEHRHLYDKKTPEKKSVKSNKMGDYTDYEEIK